MWQHAAACCHTTWWWSKTETCRMDIYVYFNVNFNVFFKIKKCICWWVNCTCAWVFVLLSDGKYCIRPKSPSHLRDVFSHILLIMTSLTLQSISILFAPWTIFKHVFAFLSLEIQNNGRLIAAYWSNDMKIMITIIMSSESAAEIRYDIVLNLLGHQKLILTYLYGAFSYLAFCWILKIRTKFK